MAERRTFERTLEPHLTTESVPSYTNPAFPSSIGIGTYLIILCTATSIVLIWAFFIFFFFARGPGGRMSSSRIWRALASAAPKDVNTTTAKSDPPPSYDNVVKMPSESALDPAGLPTYQDVVNNGDKKEMRSQLMKSLDLCLQQK